MPPPSSLYIGRSDDGLRHAILSGRLSPGRQLPAAGPWRRKSAWHDETEVSAVEQLRAEGYLEVAGSGPASLCLAPYRTSLSCSVYSSRRSRPTANIPTSAVSSKRRARPASFPAIGMPATDFFRWALWVRLVARQARRREARTFADYGPPTGYGPLRPALLPPMCRLPVSAACRDDDILVTGGALAGAGPSRPYPGLGLATEVWIEESHLSTGRKDAFTAASAKVVPVPLTRKVSACRWALSAPNARLVYP